MDEMSGPGWQPVNHSRRCLVESDPGRRGSRGRGAADVGTGECECE